MLSLDDVLRGTSAHLAYPVDHSTSFSGVANDSRHVQPGDLFVALRAERDGHAFIADAFQRGARGVLAEQVDALATLPVAARGRFAWLVSPNSLLALQSLAAHWLRRHSSQVVAITGSVGKTTTKELVAAVLAQRYTVLKSERNLNNEIGLPISVLGLRPEHQRLVLEMGMYAVGEIATLCRIAPPRIGIVTNVGPSHLARLGTVERIAAAKSELPAALPADGFAILNGDDPFVTAMATGAKIIRYGTAPHCDLRATAVRSHGLQGIEFTLRDRDTEHSTRSPLPGRHSLYACLAAAAVGVAEGLRWSEIDAGLAAGAEHTRVVPVAGRHGSLILDDTYNASPASVIAGLDLLAELPGRRIAILADMFELGHYEEEGHREVGRHAAATVDQLVVVGERARWIGMAAQVAGLGDVTFVHSKEDVVLDLHAGDHVLVKGSRGMAMEEVVARLRQPTDAAQEVTEQ